MSRFLRYPDLTGEKIELMKNSFKRSSSFTRTIEIPLEFSDRFDTILLSVESLNSSSSDEEIITQINSMDQLKNDLYNYAISTNREDYIQQIKERTSYIDSQMSLARNLLQQKLRTRDTPFSILYFER